MFYSVVLLAEQIYQVENFAQLIDSVKNKLWPLGDDIYFIPGHGPASTFKVERETNPFVSDSALS